MVAYQVSGRLVAGVTGNSPAYSGESRSMRGKRERLSSRWVHFIVREAP